MLDSAWSGITQPDAEIYADCRIFVRFREDVQSRHSRHERFDTNTPASADETVYKPDRSFNTRFDRAELTETECARAAVGAAVELVEEGDDAVDVVIDELRQSLVLAPTLDEVLGAGTPGYATVRGLRVVRDSLFNSRVGRFRFEDGTASRIGDI